MWQAGATTGGCNLRRMQVLRQSEHTAILQRSSVQATVMYFTVSCYQMYDVPCCIPCDMSLTSWGVAVMQCHLALKCNKSNYSCRIWYILAKDIYICIHTHRHTQTIGTGIKCILTTPCCVGSTVTNLGITMLPPGLFQNFSALGTL
jgi:hypothetical protein